MEVFVKRPRPTKKINGAKTVKNMTSAIGDLNPLPPARFLWMPAPDNPRFNAIANQNLKHIKQIKEVLKEKKKGGKRELRDEFRRDLAKFHR